MKCSHYFCYRLHLWNLVKMKRKMLLVHWSDCWLRTIAMLKTVLRDDYSFHCSLLQKCLCPLRWHQRLSNRFSFQLVAKHKLWRKRSSVEAFSDVISFEPSHPPPKLTLTHVLEGGQINECDHKRLTAMDAHVLSVRACMRVSDQEGGRWRSVSPEGALRVGLRSEEEEAVRRERMVEIRVSFSRRLKARGLLKRCCQKKNVKV